MQTKDLKKLTKKWYDKLAETGFVDIETSEGDLKNYEFRRFDPIPSSTEKSISRSALSSSRLIRISAIASYYRMASEFNNKHKFANKCEQLIWGYHTEGHSYRKISRLLTKSRFKVSKSVIHRLIKRLKEVMITEYETGT